MKKLFYPYKIPAQTDVQVKWFINNNHFEHSGILDEWSPQDNLAIRISVSYAYKKIKKYMNKKGSCDLLLTWQCSQNSGGNYQQGLVGRETICDNNSLELSGNIPGQELTGAVILSCVLVVGEPGVSTDIFLPDERSLVIWSEEIEVLLEGNNTMFPVSDLDFEKSKLPQNAFYLLQKSRNCDLKEPFISAYQLILNNNHHLWGMITDNVSKEPVMKFLEYNIVKDLIVDTLCRSDYIEELESSSDFGITTLGGVLNYLFKEFFPNKSYSGILDLYNNNRKQFDLIVQDKLLK